MPTLRLVLVCAIGLSGLARAANLKVHCGVKSSLSTITAALKLLPSDEPNTISVFGSCNENITIQSFDRLTLVAESGASINDTSGGAADVVDILDSQRITIQGFTINGGLFGILCSSHSLCRLRGNTIQGGSSSGLVVDASSVESVADVMQNCPTGEGLVVRQAGQASTDGDTMQGNGDVGILVNAGSFLFAVNTTVRNNDEGIHVLNHSTIRLSSGNNVLGNAGSGIVLAEGSEALFGSPNVVNGNAVNGVSIDDLSFAQFQLPGNDISGNAVQPDVACNPQFSATRGAHTNIGAGTTNCTEP